jgi:hypothetical protein
MIEVHYLPKYSDKTISLLEISFMIVKMRLPVKMTCLSHSIGENEIY